MEINNKVLVGISGGVDSATTAYLLQKKGYDVYGCFIKTWQPDFIECTWREERRDAIRVCAHLNIPFFELDMETEYRDDVAMYMINEYKHGRTPNPDVMCNKYVKFKGLINLADKIGCYHVATGHYARTIVKDDDIFLARGIDPLKDQSYFLYQIDRHILPRLLFPLGGYIKQDIRTFAHKAKLPIATKKDSQGVCFLGDIDMKKFLKEFIEVKPGNIVSESGELLGFHDGAILYTIGERKGLHITSDNINRSIYYVKSKNLERNELMVTEIKPNEREQSPQNIVIENVNILLPESSLLKNLVVDVRYHAKPISCEISLLGNGIAQLALREYDYAIASGQSMVLYLKDGICVGGGIVR